MRIYLLVILVNFTFLIAKGQNDLVLNNSQRYYGIKGSHMQVFEDTANVYSNVKELEFVPFRSIDSYYFTTKHPKSTYWIKFNLTDSSDFNNHWFFVSYNYSIDSLDIWISDKTGPLFTKQYRFMSSKLSDKDVAHKNLTFDLPIQKNTPIVVYLKIKNKNPGQYGFALQEHKEFFSSSFFEYYFFGFFYGGLLIISLYHLIFFISLRDKAYLFYSTYIVIQAIYMSYRDATALVFIFPDSPWLIDSTHNLVMALLSVSLLLYARFFLHLNNYKLFNILIGAFIIIRLPFLFIVSNYTVELMWFDLIAALIAFIFSIISLFQKQKTAILFTISFGVIIIGYLINVLWHADIITASQNIFYSLYYAVALESLLLAFANSYRLGKLRTGILLKKILEEKVNENMLRIKLQEELIKEKSDDLDILLYRASHDIKGPLKSIDGLCMVGLKDDKEKDIYFKLIASTSQRLQNILNSLLNIAKQNRSELKIEPVFIYQLVDECINEHLIEYPGLKDLQFEVNIPDYLSIASEKYSLLSIVQNITENAIKYRDKTKKINKLSITFKQSNEFNTLIFEDNGLGINEISLKNIFQMFYRANSENPEGAGLGLYIVKQNVERLKGKITIDSEEGKFTRMLVELPIRY